MRPELLEGRVGRVRVPVSRSGPRGRGSEHPSRLWYFRVSPKALRSFTCHGSSLSRSSHDPSPLQARVSLSSRQLYRSGPFSLLTLQDAGVVRLRFMYVTVGDLRLRPRGPEEPTSPFLGILKGQDGSNPCFDYPFLPSYLHSNLLYTKGYGRTEGTPTSKNNSLPRTLTINKGSDTP